MALKRAYEPGATEYSHGRGIVNPAFVDGSMVSAKLGELGNDVPWQYERMLDAQNMRHGNQDDPTIAGYDPYGKHVSPKFGDDVGGKTLEERGGFALVREASPNLAEGYTDPNVRRMGNNPWRNDEVSDPSRKGWEGGNFDEEVNKRTVAGNPDMARLAIATNYLAPHLRGSVARVGFDALPNSIHENVIKSRVPVRSYTRVPKDPDGRWFMGKPVRLLKEIDPRYWEEL